LRKHKNNSSDLKRQLVALLVVAVVVASAVFFMATSRHTMSAAQPVRQSAPSAED